MGGKTATTTQQVSIPPEVLARYNAINTRAEQVASKPFVAYSEDPNAFVAGLTPTQQAGMANINALQGMATPDVQEGQGLIRQGIGQGQQLTGMSLGTAGRGQQIGEQLYGQSLDTSGQGLESGLGVMQQSLAAIPQAAQTGQGFAQDAAQRLYSGIAAAQPYMGESGALTRQGLGVGQQYAGLAGGYLGAGTQAVGPGALETERYMSPYTESVVQATLGNLREQQQQERAALRGQAIRAGAFGTDRARIAEANLARQQELATAAAISPLYQQAFQQAQGVAGQQQQLGLSAEQANRAAQQFGAQQAAALGQQQYAQGLGAAQQLASLGQALYGQNIGQGQAIQSLGQQQYAQELGAAQAAAQMGQNLYGMTAQQAQLQQAAAAGMFGQAAQVAALQQQAGQNMFNYGLQGGQGVANLGLANQAAQLQAAQAQMAAGQVQQQTDQAAKTAMYNQFLQQQGFPYQQTQFLGNIGMGTGALSGSTTTTQQPVGFFSDKRLKEDAEKIGETYDGQPIYSFKYKGDDRTQMGLMAQDVEKKHPEAVGLAGGYKMVDYKKATEDAAKRGKFNTGGLVPSSMGGPVYEPGAYMDGGLAGYRRGFADGGDADNVASNWYSQGTPDSETGEVTWINSVTGESVRGNNNPGAGIVAPKTEEADAIANLDPRIKDYYDKYVFRAPDEAGAAYWQGLLESGTPIEEIEKGIAESRERNLVNQEPLTYDASKFATNQAPVMNRYGAYSAPVQSLASSFDPARVEVQQPTATGKGPASTAPTYGNMSYMPFGGQPAYNPMAGLMSGYQMGMAGPGAMFGQPSYSPAMPTASGKGPAVSSGYAGGYGQPAPAPSYYGGGLGGYGAMGGMGGYGGYGGYGGGYGQPMGMFGGYGGMGGYGAGMGGGMPGNFSAMPSAGGKSNTSGMNRGGRAGFRDGGRTGYATGGWSELFGPYSLVAAHKSMYGSMGEGVGAPGSRFSPKARVPLQAMVKPTMLKPAAAPRQQESGLQQAASFGKTLENLMSSGSKLKEYATKGLQKAGLMGGTSTVTKEPATSADKSAAGAKPVSSGLYDPNTDEGYYIPGQDNEGIGDASPEMGLGAGNWDADFGSFDTGDFFAKGGRAGLAVGGIGSYQSLGEDPVTSEGGAYDTDTGFELKIPSKGNEIKPLEGAKGGIGKPRGVGDDLMDAAKLAGSTATAATAIMALFSDRRLKENIRPIGKLYDGQKVYSYNYKGDKRTQIGLMADEVEKKRPDAVKTAREVMRSKRMHGGRTGYQDGGMPEEASAAEFFTEDQARMPNRQSFVGAWEDAMKRQGGDPVLATVDITQGPQVIAQAAARAAKTGGDVLAALPNATKELLSGVVDKAVGVLAPAQEQGRGLAAAADLPAQGAIETVGAAPAVGLGSPVVGPNVGAGPQVKPPGPFESTIGRALPDSVPKDANFWIPLIAGVGGMLASRNPTLGGAIGEGLVSAASAYEARQSAEVQRKSVEAGTQKTYQEMARKGIFLDPYGIRMVTAFDTTTGNFAPVKLSELAKNPDRYRVSADVAGDIRKQTNIPIKVYGASAGPAITSVYASLSPEDRQAASDMAYAFNNKRPPTPEAGYSPEQLKAMRQPFIDQENAAKNMRLGREAFMSYAASLAALPPGGLSAAGLRDSQREWLKSVNTILRSMNLKTVTSDDMNANLENIKKQVSVLASQGNRSDLTLSNMLASFPTAENTKKGGALLMSGLLIERKREIDADNYFRNWRSFVAKQIGGDNEIWADSSGRDLRTRFDEKTKQIYQEDKKELEKLFNLRTSYGPKGNRKTTSLMTLFIRNPELMKDKRYLDFMKENNINRRVLQYFVGGK